MRLSCARSRKREPFIWGQWLITAVLKPLFGLLLPYDVEGQENLPPEGPAIVLMNHVNFLDVVAPGTFLRRQVVMLSKVENFSLPVLGPFVRAYGSLPIHRGEVDLTAVRLSLRALERGQVLVVAPEGTRSGDGRLQPGHDGLAFLATRAGVPVVPFVSYGHEHYMSTFKRLRRPRLHIRVGKPFRFVARGHLRRSDLRPMTDEAMYRLAALLPPEYRGAYADLSRATSRYTEPYEPAAEGVG